MNRQIYKMTIADASDSITFYLLEVPIVEEDVGGTATNTTIDGNVYTDYMWLKKQWKQKWSIMCKDEYTKLHDIFERQFTNAEVPNLKIFYGDNIHTDGNAEGQSFQITNDSETYDGEILDFSLYGNTTQETLSGKNLLDYKNAVPSTNATTITMLANGFKSSTTANGYATKIQLSGLETNTTYTLSLDCTKITSQTNRFVRIYDGTTQSTTIATASNVGNDAVLTFTTLADSQINIWFYDGSPTQQLTETNWTDIQLQKGSTATPYEPYCGGIPAPNPDFPMPVENVSGAQMVKVCGKNLCSGLDSGYYDAPTKTLTATASTVFKSFKIALNQGVYTLSCNTNINLVRAFTDYDNSGNVVFDGQQINIHNFTMNVTQVTTLYLSFRRNDNTDWLGTDLIQLELGSQATTYEPYQGQSYEINLGKNLFDYQNIVTLANGVGTLFSSGEYRSSYVKVQAGQTYTISRASTSSPSRFRISFTKDVPAIGVAYYSETGQAGTVNNIINADSETKHTFTVPAEMNYAFIYLSNSSQTITESMAIQLEAGTQATSYSPYKTPMELCKIGTYQDYIYKDGDKWYKHAEIGKVVYTGAQSESWSQGAYGTNSFYISLPDRMLPTDHTPSLNYANLFRGIPYSQRSTAGSNTIYNDFGVGLYIRNTSITSLADFRTMLGTANLVSYYVLATPTDTEITDSELVGQLDALLEGSLYKGLNNVFLIPSVAPDGTMTMEYRIIYEKETIVQDTTPVKLDLTDGGIINACLCRQNVQVIMRETKDSSES